MSHNRNKALDGLRGVAVSLVVGYHAGWLPDAGPVGVEVFFTLSGFLITSLLLKEHARTGRIDLLRFWARRAARIFPPLLAVVAVVAIVGVVVSGKIDRSVVPALGFFANWAIIASGSDQHWTLGVSWSLAVEEQFYIVWPLCILVIAKLGITRCTAISLAMFATLFAILSRAIAVAHSDALHYYYGTDTRADLLLMGAALAVALRAGALSSAKASVLGMGLVFGAGFLCALLPDRASMIVAPTVVELSTCLAILLTVIVPAFRRVLSNPLLVWLGGISYSLYLWHTLVIGVAAHVTPAVPMVLVVLLAVGVSAVSHRLTEVPYLALRERLRSEPATTRTDHTPALEGSAA